MSPTAIDAWIALAAVLGAPVGWEKVRRPDRDYGETTRILMLLWLAIVAWAWSTTWRGFAYVLLMPIGAYKVGDIAGQCLALRWPTPRRREASADGRDTA